MVYPGICKQEKLSCGEFIHKISLAFFILKLGIRIVVISGAGQGAMRHLGHLYGKSSRYLCYEVRKECNDVVTMYWSQPDLCPLIFCQGEDLFIPLTPEAR